MRTWAAGPFALWAALALAAAPAARRPGGAAAVDSVKALELKGKGTRRVQGNDRRPPAQHLTRMQGALLLVALACALPALAVQQPSPSPAPSVGTPTAEEKADDAILSSGHPHRVAGAQLVDKAMELLGGAAAIDSVRTLVVVSKATRQTTAGAVDVETTVQIAFPERYRQDVVLDQRTHVHTGGTAGSLPGDGDGRIAAARRRARAPKRPTATATSWP